MRAAFLAVLLSGCTTINNTTIVTTGDGAAPMDLAISIDSAAPVDMTHAIDLAPIILNDLSTGDGASCVAPGTTCKDMNELYCCRKGGVGIMNSAATCGTANACKETWIWQDPVCPAQGNGQPGFRSCYNVGGSDVCGGCQ